MPAELHVGWNEAAPTGAGKSATVKMLLQHGDNTTTSNKRTAHLASDRAYRPFSAPPPRPCRRPPVFHFALVPAVFGYANKPHDCIFVSPYAKRLRPF